MKESKVFVRFVTSSDVRLLVKEILLNESGISGVVGGGSGVDDGKGSGVDDG